MPFCSAFSPFPELKTCTLLHLTPGTSWASGKRLRSHSKTRGGRFNFGKLRLRLKRGVEPHLKAPFPTGKTTADDRSPDESGNAAPSADTRERGQKARNYPPLPSRMLKAAAPDLPTGTRGKSRESERRGRRQPRKCQMNYSEVVLQSAGPDQSSRCSGRTGESDFPSPLLGFLLRRSPAHAEPRPQRFMN